MCRIKTINGRTIIGSNMSTLTTGDGSVILFSYETPVAALLPDGRRIQTEQKFSNTTTKHINKWGAKYAPKVSQATFDRLGQGQTWAEAFAPMFR